MSGNIDELSGEESSQIQGENAIDNGFEAYYAAKNKTSEGKIEDDDGEEGDDSSGGRASAHEADTGEAMPQSKAESVEGISDDDLSQEDKSWFGRLKKSQSENDSLRQRIAALEQQSNRAQAYESVKVTIPEELREDIDIFKKAYPQLALAAELPGLEGDIVRKQIAEYGADYAAGTALAVVKDYNLREEQHKKGVAAYRAGVFAKRPDISKMPVKEYEAYSYEVKAWILRNPDHEEQDRLLKTYNAEEGYDTPDHLVNLFNEFDKSKSQASINASKQNKRRQSIDEGLAVPTNAYSRVVPTSTGGGDIADPQKRGFDDYFKKRRN